MYKEASDYIRGFFIMNNNLTYKICLPISIQLSKKKKFYLNLNQYRNEHFFVLNKAKVLFAELIKPLLKIPLLESCSIDYVLYTGSNRLVDISNICCIVDKFFCDTLSENGIIEDDNLNIIKNINYSFGSVDKNNPRVEAIIHSVVLKKTKEEPMQVILNQNEIEQAIEKAVREQININKGQKVSISLESSRGEEGFIAIIEFDSNNNSGPVTRSVDTPVKEESVREEPKKESPSTAQGNSLFSQENVTKANTTVEAAPIAVQTANSLFGNLTKPVNAPKESE